MGLLSAGFERIAEEALAMCQKQDKWAHEDRGEWRALGEAAQDTMQRAGQVITDLRGKLSRIDPETVRAILRTYELQGQGETLQQACAIAGDEFDIDAETLRGYRRRYKSIRPPDWRPGMRGKQGAPHLRRRT
jgi:hypothetical protein